MYGPHFVYLFIHRRMSGLFPPFSYYEQRHFAHGCANQITTFKSLGYRCGGGIASIPVFDFWRTKILIIYKLVGDCHFDDPDGHMSQCLCPCVGLSLINCGPGRARHDWATEQHGQSLPWLAKYRESNAMPIPKLDFNWSYSFHFLPLGRLTLGTVLLELSHHAVGQAKWPSRESCMEKNQVPQVTIQLGSQSRANWLRCSGIPDILTSAEFLVSASDDYNCPPTQLTLPGEEPPHERQCIVLSH